MTHTIPIWNACPATSCSSDLLSALAGLSTTIGSLLGLFVRKPGPRFMTLTLGFSAGGMASFAGALESRELGMAIALCRGRAQRP